MKYKDRFLKKLLLIIAVVAFAAPLGLQELGKINPFNPIGHLFETTQEKTPTTPQAANDNTPILSKNREQHILYGDGSGGGHLYGTGKPCKSEFPKEWSAGNVIHAVQSIAANDNIKWRVENNGYHTGEKMIGDVRVRVVLDEDRSHIITAYPTNLPRNPCLANDR